MGAEQGAADAKPKICYFLCQFSAMNLTLFDKKNGARTDICLSSTEFGKMSAKLCWEIYALFAAEV